MAVRSPVFIFTQTPVANASAREGVEALLACAAFDLQPSVMFIDQGVLQLLPQGEAPGSKNLNKMLQALELYGVEGIYVCQSSLSQFGLTSADINPCGQLIKPSERAAILANASWVANF